MAYKPTGNAQVDNVSKSLDALINAPNFLELDAKYNISQDLIYMANDLQIKRETAERFRLKRANQACFLLSSFFQPS